MHIQCTLTATQGEWFAAMRRPTICGCKAGSSGCCMLLLTVICSASSSNFTWSLLSYTRYLHARLACYTFTSIGKFACYKQMLLTCLMLCCDTC